MKKNILFILLFVFPFFLAAQVYPISSPSIDACNGIFTDSGELIGNYGPNENFTTTICPSFPNRVMQVFFQSSILGIGDTLCIFDGNTDAAPQLRCLHSMSANTFMVEASSTNLDGCLTFNFKSDDSNEAPGWSASLSCATPCQDFSALITEVNPPVFPADTGFVDLCLGDTVSFTAGTDFFQNNFFYQQDEATSTFRWNMGDGTILTGKNITHSYTTAGGYFVRLEVTDTLGCKNTNEITQRVRVTGSPNFNIQTDYSTGTCEGDTVRLISQPSLTNGFFSPSSEVLTDTTTMLIPDGDGLTITSNLFISSANPGTILEEINETFKVCINIEHSFMFDLDIRLRCPAGNSVALQLFEIGQGGEFFLGEPNETDDFPMGTAPGIGYDYCFTNNPTNQTLTEYTFDSVDNSIPAGIYAPSEPLSLLEGCPINGEWGLEITDNISIDNGYLFSWSLDFGSANQAPSSTNTFSFPVANQGWLDQPAIFQNLGDTVFARIDSTQNFTYIINYENGCSADTTILIESQSETILACSDCDDLVVDAGSDTFIACAIQIVTLNAANSSNGEYFIYEWSTPDGNISGNTDSLTATVTSPGLYIFTLSSSLTNCMISDTVVVAAASNTPLANAGLDFPFPCDATEAILDGTGSTIGPDFQFEWTAGTGEILSNANTLNPVITEPGIYLLEITNTITGCVSMDTVVVTSQVFTDILTTAASCDGADGNATVIIPAGTNAPSFAWSNGQSGPVAENLMQGWYSVTVTDGDGCATHQNVFVEEELSCKVQITGKVVIDNLVPDCFEDPLSIRQKEVLLHLLPADEYTYSDQNGEYLFVTETGDHTIEIISADYLENLCPTDGLIEISTPTNGSIAAENDFYLTYVPGSFDLSISYFSGIARAGMENTYNLSYCNAGEATVSGTLTFVHDEIEQSPAPNPVPPNWTYNSVTNTATWTFTDLAPGQCLNQQIDLSVPTNTVTGTVLTSSLEIATDGIDFNPDNNSKSWSQEVVGSFDPNDKQVFTKNGENQFGGIIYESDTSLTYQIRFQNTGNDTAFAVLIRDTLDQALDVTSIRPGVSSHPYRLEMEGNNILIFNFENIMLPDSNVNLSASQGYVTFTIDRKLNIPFGTTITNSAAIYFDYNPPIITNQVINVLSELVSVENIEDKKPSIKIIPNPTQGKFSVLYHLKSTSNIAFSIFDIYGKIIFKSNSILSQTAGSHTKAFSLEAFPNGIYSVQLDTPNGKVVKKIVKIE